MSFVKNTFGASKFAEKIKETSARIPMGDGAVWSDTTPLRSAAFEIGGWDMDTDGQVDVITNINMSKLRFVAVSVTNDAQTGWHFAIPYQAGGPISELYYVAGDGFIRIARAVGSAYDAVGYDDATINRGFVTIFYTD